MKQKGIVFLFIGLGALTLFVLIGLFVFYPKDNSAKTPPVNQLTNAVGTPVPQTFDPVEWSRTGQGTVTAPTTSPAPTVSPLGTPQPTSAADGFVVTMNPPGNSAPVTATPSPVTFPAPATSYTEHSTSGTVSHRTKELSREENLKVREKKSIAKVRHESTVRHKEVAAVLRTQYWIQVGAYTNRYQAERMSHALAAQGLKGTLVTAVSQGKTIIRVRVGPYAQKQEAEKFLTWVKPVKGMEASFITVVHAR